MTATRRFRCRPESVPAARRFVRDVLGNHQRATLDAAELMVSELSSNCVQHARTDFELAIHVDGQIRIEVRDTRPGRPTPRSPAPLDPTGRGLWIIEMMADAWGVDSTADGKIVWFTLRDMGRASNETAISASSRDGESRAVDSPTPLEYSRTGR